MFWAIAIGGGLLSLALLGGGALLLARAQKTGGGKVLPIALIVAGCAVMIGTIVGAILANPEQPVGSAAHEVEVVSRSSRSRQFYVTLRNVETGEVYEDIRLRSRTTGKRCPNGPRHLNPGRRFVAPFTLWENRNTGVRTEAPNAVELGRIMC
ncbi:MAG TPA: hypothetical protein VGB08_10500 [Allosphingosinicella sp.]|jgi:hypothetical protein